MNNLLKIVTKNKHTPVIMISGHATVQIAVEATRLERTNYRKAIYKRKNFKLC